jgi:VanZ like family
MLKITRAVAWIVVIGLIVISLVPAPLRPGTGVSHNFEHFGSFLLAGVFWYLAYADRLLLRLGTVVAFAGGIELLQILMPGRHARFTDFAADALGGCAGILITFLVTRRYRASEPNPFRRRAVAAGSLTKTTYRNRFIMNPNFPDGL